MKSKLVWRLSFLFTLVMAFCLITATPSVLRAAGNVEVCITEEMTVAEIQIAIQDVIDDPANDQVVTVTGSKTHIGQYVENEQIFLHIPDDITVIWNAVYTGYGYIYPNVITLTGDGVFVVGEDAHIRFGGKTGAIIKAQDNSLICVNGGLIEAFGEMSAIEGNADIRITNGTITGGLIPPGKALISSFGDQATVSISGGTLLAGGNEHFGPVIGLYGNNSVVNMNGGIVSTSGNGISLGNTLLTGTHANSIIVSGSALVETTGKNCSAIRGENAFVTVNGGEVRATGSGGNAIMINHGDIVASDGIIQASGDATYDMVWYHMDGQIEYMNLWEPYAIRIRSGSVTIFENALVEASGNGGYAIYSNDADVTINGGIVSATGGFYKGNYMGVYDWGSTIYVRGNGSIAITGGEVIATRGSAIGTMRGAVNISGGTVRATTGEAIVNYSSFNGVTLTGGAVFAYGNALSDVVFSSSFVESTGSSLVIAYDKNEETNYVRNSATDLAVWPSLSPAAAMYWALQDGVPGIYYTREGNEGFIAVPEISIVETELPYDPLYVELDHQLYALTFDTPPRFLNGQILAPFRPFGELLGYTVTWDAATSSISMEKPGSTIEMALGDRFCTVNGARFDLTTEPEAIDGRTFIPLYAFRSVGYAIAWDNEKSVLVITSPPNTLVMPYTIAFHANQGTGSMQSQIVLRSGDYTIATNAFTRAEYRFTGWNTAANGSGVSYAPEAMITDIQSDITLYAQWQLIIRVPGDVNSDGAVDMADILLIYQHFRGRVQLTGEELNAADVNGDGKVDMADVLFVYHHFRGIS